MEEFTQPILNAEEAIILLLLIAAFVAIGARRFRLPYTVGLVLIGLILTLFTPVDFRLSPDVVLGLLVPPLVFEAAFHIRVDDLRRDFWLILLLAIPGVIITTLLVGGVVSWGTGMSIQIALVFGALVAATDPVAVVALFRRLGVPKRLQILLEGESLFNDGTAIVMFGLMLEVAIQGKFDLAASVAAFFRDSGGGVLIGLVLGMLASQIIGSVDDALVETTITTVLAFGAYLAAEAFHVSGVLAVVTAGIVNGNVGPRGMSPTTRIVVFNFWEYGAFLANSLVFLLIGLTTDVHLLIANWQIIGVAILAALVARAVSIYGFSVFGKDIPGEWIHVLYWGGLRGAIALALALSIPEELGAARGRLQAMAFGVVLFTLLVQGISMDALVRRLKLIHRTPYQDEYERRHARFVASRAALNHLRRMWEQGLISEQVWTHLVPLFEKRNEVLRQAVKEVLTSDPTVEVEELDTARRETLRVQRAALTDLLRDGVISEEIYSELVGEVDAALTEKHVNWTLLLKLDPEVQSSIKRLMLAILQPEDLERAIGALNRAGIPVAHFSTAGGFLNRRNETLLIGLPKGREEEIVYILKKSCRKRVKFARSFQEGKLPLLSHATPVTVGGATIFCFDVEAYHEF
jgi:CPA1 family monovalent cation:H+ antiporter